MELKSRNFGLDVIRAVSIMLVILQHAGIHPLVLSMGGVGVEIFFVLSGFLIGEIIIKNQFKENSFRAVKNFWIRRWFRILPLYYLVLFVKFLFHSDIGTNIIYYFLFLQNNFYGISFFSVSWSLVIEEWFYLFMPLFFLFILKIKTSDKNKLLLISLLLFIVFEMLLRLVWVYKTNRPFMGIIGNFPFRLDSLAVGVLLAHLKLNYRNAYSKLASLNVFLVALLFFIVYVFFWDHLVRTDLMDRFIFTRTVWFTLTSVLIALIVPYMEDKHKEQMTGGGLKQGLGKFITLTSILTYALYLLHTFVFSFILRAGLFSATWWIQLFAAITALYLCSWIVYRFYEKPMMDLRERFK